MYYTIRAMLTVQIMFFRQRRRSYACFAADANAVCHTNFRPLPGPDAGQHCPYCLSHDDFPAFPVSLILFSPVELAGLGLFLIPRTILTLSKPVWSAPQGRAPPVFS